MTDTLTTYNPGNQFRHSSSWSPARKHPISGKVIRHAGEDWAATTGTPIVAAAAGKIAASGEGNGYGNYVILEHELNGKPVYTMYAHLDSLPHGKVVDGKSATTGQPVHIGQGETIGPCGNTGVSKGSHVHFEVRTGIEKDAGYQGFLKGTSHNPREFDISQLQHPDPDRRQEMSQRPTHSPDVTSPSPQADKASVLLLNSRGAKVSELQEKLNQLYPNGELLETKSGIYGPKTKAAVEAFQKAHDLVQDGKVGEQTLNKLNELLAKAQEVKAPEAAVAEPKVDLANLKSELQATQAEIAGLQEKIAALHAKETAEKVQQPESALNMNIVAEPNKSIMFRQDSNGLQCQVNGKVLDASSFMRFGEKMSTMETYQNADRSLLGKYLPESDQFEIFLKGATGANKIAVVNDFSKQNTINLTGQMMTQDNNLSQQKNVDASRGR